MTINEIFSTSFDKNDILKTMQMIEFFQTFFRKCVFNNIYDNNL